MIGDKGIKAVCKRCGKSAPASEYVLDAEYKMMVCPNCIKERKDKFALYKKLAEEKEKAKTEKVTEEKRPVGWDNEDAYLDRIYKMREKVNVEVKPIDAERVKYTCPKCKYSFIYNKVKQYPGNCSFCGTKVFTFKM